MPFFQNIESLETALEGCPDPTGDRVIIIISGGGGGGQIGGGGGDGNGGGGSGGNGGGDGSTDGHFPPTGPLPDACTTTTTADPSTTTTTTVAPDCVHPPSDEVTICLELRDGSGVPIDLTPYDPSLWGDEACCRIEGAKFPMAVYQRVGCQCAPKYYGNLIFPEEEELESGVVCMTVPPEIANCPGIYRAGVLLTDPIGNPAFYQEFLVSVEPSLVTNCGACGCNGPLTIAEVRMKLRDYAGLNDAWDNVEFSDAEIIAAMLRPINHFNGTTPLGTVFDTCTWPQIWRSRWLDATCSQLLLTSAYNYMRNARNIQTAGGVTEDRNQRWRAYLQLSEGEWREFEYWAKSTKVTMAWSGGFGSLGGTAHGHGHYGDPLY